MAGRARPSSWWCACKDRRDEPECRTDEYDEAMELTDRRLGLPENSEFWDELRERARARDEAARPRDEAVERVLLREADSHSLEFGDGGLRKPAAQRGGQRDRMYRGLRRGMRHE